MRNSTDPNGPAFEASLAARFWWSAMYLTVIAAVAWYRFAVPRADLLT